MKIASMVREKVDSIIDQIIRKSKIIIMGDFNCTPDDQIIQLIVQISRFGKSLVNLSDSLS